MDQQHSIIVIMHTPHGVFEGSAIPFETKEEAQEKADEILNFFSGRTTAINPKGDRLTSLELDLQELRFGGKSKIAFGKEMLEQSIMQIKVVAR